MTVAHVLSMALDVLYRAGFSPGSFSAPHRCSPRPLPPMSPAPFLPPLVHHPILLPITLLQAALPRSLLPQTRSPSMATNPLPSGYCQPLSLTSSPPLVEHPAHQTSPRQQCPRHGPSTLLLEGLPPPCPQPLSLTLINSAFYIHIVLKTQVHLPHLKQLLLICETYYCIISSFNSHNKLEGR